MGRLDVEAYDTAEVRVDGELHGLASALLRGCQVLALHYHTRIDQIGCDVRDSGPVEIQLSGYVRTGDAAPLPYQARDKGGVGILLEQIVVNRHAPTSFQ